MSARLKVTAALVSFAMLVALSTAASARASAVTLTASARNVDFRESVTLVATVDPPVGGQAVSILDALGVELVSGTTGTDGTFSTDVQPDANLVAHASSLGVDSAPVSVGVRPLMTLSSGAVRLFDDVKVRGTFKPVREGQPVTVELEHRGEVVGPKRPRWTRAAVHARRSSSRRPAADRACDLGRIRPVAGTRRDGTVAHRRSRDLALGAHGVYVGLLERRLVQLHYHLVGVDDVFDYRTADAVMAFHKVQGWHGPRSWMPPRGAPSDRPGSSCRATAPTASTSRSTRRGRCSSDRA